MAGNRIEPAITIEEFGRRCRERLKSSRQKMLDEAKTPEERRNLERRFQAEDERAKHPMMVIPE